jgi:hypothetical protein
VSIGDILGILSQAGKKARKKTTQLSICKYLYDTNVIIQTRPDQTRPESELFHIE